VQLYFAALDEKRFLSAKQLLTLYKIYR